MTDFGYKPNMSYREFREARLANMEAEQQRHKAGSGDWAYWKGRALSYRDMLGVLDGSQLITSTPGKKLDVATLT
jgi:hypothetical protein